MKSVAIGSLLVLLAFPAAAAAGLEPYLVKDINPVASPAGSRPETFAALGGTAVFEASDGSDRNRFGIGSGIGSSQV